MKYQRGIRDLNEEYDEKNAVFTDSDYKLIFEMDKPEEPEVDGTFIAREDAQLTKGSEPLYLEPDARTPYTSLSLNAKASQRVSSLWLYEILSR